MLGPTRLEPFARALIETSRDWIAAKRRAVLQSGNQAKLGFECHLHDSTGERFASIAMPPGPLLDVAGFVEVLVTSLDTSIIAICSEGLIYDSPVANVRERFEIGDPTVEVALVVIVGERTTRRISSVQFPFVADGDRIQIVALRSGDRSIDVREVANGCGVDPVAGPLASALAAGFAASVPSGISRRIATATEGLRRLNAAASITGGFTGGFTVGITVGIAQRNPATALDVQLLDAVFTARHRRSSN